MKGFQDYEISLDLSIEDAWRKFKTIFSTRYEKKLENKRLCVLLYLIEANIQDSKVVWNFTMHYKLPAASR